MEALLSYFPDITPLQRSRFEALKPLYEEWNQQINVVSRKDIDQLYLHHVLHSLALCKVLPVQEGTRILDLGTGGGFPGIPLAIFYPQARFLLVDSIGKKLKVAQAVASSLGLDNVEITHCRAEEVNEKFQFVVSRAVARLPEIAGWVKGKFAKQPGQKVANGIFCLKGGNLEEETAPFPGRVTEIAISDYFKEEYFLTKKIIYLTMQG